MNLQIQTKNIHKIYGKGDNKFSAIKDLSCNIKKGESVAILGKSGSGKSTLMHILGALDTPSKGSVLLDNKNISDISEGEKNSIRNKYFGFVFQQFFLMPNESVLDNVTLPLKIRGEHKDKRDKLGMEMLRMVGMEEKAHQKAVNLSGGQKQRTVIARALVTEPPVVFADEPTGNLDSETGKQIVNLLFKFNKDKNITLIIVTHDRSLAERCDRQLEIKDGMVM